MNFNVLHLWQKPKNDESIRKDDQTVKHRIRKNDQTVKHYRNKYLFLLVGLHYTRKFASHKILLCRGTSIANKSTNWVGAIVVLGRFDSCSSNKDFGFFRIRE